MSDGGLHFKNILVDGRALVLEGHGKHVGEEGGLVAYCLSPAALHPGQQLLC